MELNKSIVYIAFLWLYTGVVFGTIFHGTAIPGGVVWGYTEPWTHITVNTHTIIADKNGFFSIGMPSGNIPHNAPYSLSLKFNPITSPSPTASNPPASLNHTYSHSLKTTTYIIPVSGRTYGKKTISGLNNALVELSPKKIARVIKDSKAIKKLLHIHTSPTWTKKKWILPVQGIISSPFGQFRMMNGKVPSRHRGLDIAVPEGTPVKAMMDGEVIGVIDTLLGGSVVIISHGGEIYSKYAHIQHIQVTVHQKVTQGTVIASAGNKGRSTGPHVHVGAYWNTTPVDPYLLVHPCKTKITCYQSTSILP